MSRPKEVFDQGDEALVLLDATEPEISHNHLPCVGCREVGDEMERLGDELEHARNSARITEAWANEVNDKYDRLRRALHALLMQGGSP